jgi:hypothetical protein
VNLELLIRVVIAALAAYRVARMVAMERGPFDLFIDFRSLIIGRWGQKKWVAEGMTCPLCIGFWASLVLFGLSYLDYVIYGVAGLAVAGLQTAIQRQERGD